MLRTAAALGIMLCAWVPRQTHACAGCSNPNLPVARNESAAKSRQLSLALSMSGTAVNFVHSTECPDLGPICQVRGEPGQLHDQMIYAAEFRPIIEFGFNDHWGIEAQVPIRVTRTTIRFRYLDGQLFTPDYENIHHRNETIVGLGDMGLSGRFRWTLLELEWTARGGLTFPTGNIQPDPFALAEQGLPHQHIQFGTGSFNPTAALEVNRRFGNLRIGAYFQTHLFFYPNRFGYQPGHRFATGLLGELTLIERLRLGLGSDVLNEQPERWSGRIQQDGNLGRTDVLVGASLGYSFTALSVGLAVKVPLYQYLIPSPLAHDAEPGQLRYPAIVNLMFSRELDLGAKPSAHRPDDGARPSD